VSDAIKFYAAESPHQLRTLRARLTKRYGDLVDAVGKGTATDWADYRHRCGVIAGLADAIVMLDATNERE
jgi:hypothetical protein